MSLISSNPCNPHRPQGPQGILGGWVFSYGRGTHVNLKNRYLIVFRERPSMRERVQGYLAQKIMSTPLGPP